jgi:hypothetical protein
MTAMPASHISEDISTPSVEYLMELELFVQVMATVLFTINVSYFFRVSSTSSCIVNVDTLLKSRVT